MYYYSRYKSDKEDKSIIYLGYFLLALVLLVIVL